MLLEANPQNVSASKMSRYTVTVKHLYLKLYSSHASTNEKDVSFVYWTVGLQEVGLQEYIKQISTR